MTTATITDIEQALFDEQRALLDRVERLDHEVATLDANFVRLLSTLLEHCQNIAAVIDDLVQREIEAAQ